MMAVSSLYPTFHCFLWASCLQPLIDDSELSASLQPLIDDSGLSVFNLLLMAMSYLFLASSCFQWVLGLQPFIDDIWLSAFNISMMKQGCILQLLIADSELSASYLSLMKVDYLSSTS
jgi:hypothetical protein